MQLIDSGLYKKKHGTIGIRVNPQVGTGTIVQMSTAGKQSKFGIGVEDIGDALFAAVRSRPWITSMHCHVGSQGCPLDLIAAGIRRMVDTALQVNREAGRQQIRTLNIGGGLPVNFKTEEISPTFADYAAVLRQHVPELFSGQFRVFTEFGRSIAAKAGFFLARVEYTKVSGGKHYATVQAGADLCVRTVYMYAPAITLSSALFSFTHRCAIRRALLTPLSGLTSGRCASLRSALRASPRPAPRWCKTSSAHVASLATCWHTAGRSRCWCRATM